MINISESHVIFCDHQQFESGSLLDVALAAWNLARSNPTASTLTFERSTGNVVDLNLSGSQKDIALRYAPLTVAGAKRGRPKLGVTAREITLLPRHWDWLSQQPGGASVTLRKLVDAARKVPAQKNEIRMRVAAAYKFMFAIAGNLPQFEDASRALFAHDLMTFEKTITKWPKDIRNELLLYLQGLGEM